MRELRKKKSEFCLTLQTPNFNILLTSVEKVPFLPHIYVHVPSSVRAMAKGQMLSVPFRSAELNWKSLGLPQHLGDFQDLQCVPIL